MQTTRARACVLLTTTAVLGLGTGLVTAGTASAHVRASAPGAAPGGYATITFTVPTESATATTTGLTVTLPPEADLASAQAQQLAGWTSSVTTSANGTPTSVVWRADAGTAIAADQFGVFALSVGPLPEAATLRFDTTQDYSDGSTVAWDEPPNADGSEPEHPAPEISLTASEGTGTEGDEGAEASTPDGTTTLTATAAPATASTTARDGTARWLGAGGLLLGALGLGLGGGAALRARRTGK